MRLAFSIAFAVVSSVVVVAEQPSVPFMPSQEQSTAIAAFSQAFPGAAFYYDNGQVSRIYGTSFGVGPDALTSADEFRRNYAAVLGVRPHDLEPRSSLQDGRHTQPLMYEPATGTYKFTLVCFSQARDGIPVFRAELRVLARNIANYPLVLAAANVRDLGDYSPDARAAVLTNTQVVDAVKRAAPTLSVFSEPKRVIWAGVEHVRAAPTLAFQVSGHSGDQASTKGYEEWLFIVDASTGVVLYKEDQVLTENVSGTVTGLTTDFPAAAECLPENSAPLPYASVNIQAQGTVYTDVNGNFTIPNPGATPVTVESRVTGRRFIVSDQSASTPVLSQSVTPPGPANFTHNAANTNEFLRASVNAYINANLVRDMVVSANPAYPTIGTQVDMGINSNINLNCNAFYSPGNQTLNFYRNGGGCSNTAFSDVIHHEYGHHVVQMGGSGQDQYGEGMGDCMAVLMTDQPKLGTGFQLNCSNGIRTADNTVQYPCSSEIHFCGQLISGCVWDMRRLLVVSNPGTYRDILKDLTVNSVPLHVGSGTITPQITTDFLTLDDDDANLANGTPHCTEIALAFGRHAMGVVGLGASYTFPSGLPEIIPPNASFAVNVNVTGVLCPTPIEGTGRLFYRVGPVGSFTQTMMTVVGSNQYQAQLPAAPCGSIIEYYFTVDHTGGSSFASPLFAPTELYRASVANTLVSYNFESTPAWTVNSTATDGQWDAAPGVPVNCSRGDPATDYEAVGSTKCWLTDNSAAASCNSDVDGGSTTLTSEAFNLTGLGDPYVRYARWYSNTFGASPQLDVFVVEVSDNNGGVWRNLETVGPSTASPNPEVNGGWFLKAYRLADVAGFNTATTQFRIRFTAADVDPGSVIEAGIDGFAVYGCPLCGAPTGDMNGDTLLNGDDIGAFIQALLTGGTQSQICAGDFNTSAALDSDDSGGFATALLAAP
ncbi:MAG: hypothetical protein HZA51_14340 [Planctomycetes bacterium]|nr:hypothetical protein [Planctomycetota bacterium]